MQTRFGMAMIGSGIVGLALLRRFAMAGLKRVLLEWGCNIQSGTSNGNSASA